MNTHTFHSVSELCTAGNYTYQGVRNLLDAGIVPNGDVHIGPRTYWTTPLFEQAVTILKDRKAKRSHKPLLDDSQHVAEGDVLTAGVINQLLEGQRQNKELLDDLFKHFQAMVKVVHQSEGMTTIKNKHNDEYKTR